MINMLICVGGLHRRFWPQVLPNAVQHIEIVNRLLRGGIQPQHGLNVGGAQIALAVSLFEIHVNGPTIIVHQLGKFLRRP